jgi:O-antigen ligase
MIRHLSERIQDLFERYQMERNYLWILLIYAAAMIIAPLAVRMFLPALALIGGGLAIFGLLFFMKNPGIGFPIIAVSSLLIPFAISTGTQTRINITLLLVMLLLASWLVKMLVFDKLFSVLPSRAIYAALAFSLSVLLSFGFGQLPWYPTKAASLFAQLGQVLLMVMSAGAFILSASRLTSSRWLKWMVFSFIILGGIYAIGFSVPSLRQYVNRIFQRAVLDSMFWTWLAVLSFGQAWLNTKLKPSIRGLFALVSAASIYTVLVTKQSWVSGWFPTAIGIFLMLFLKKPKFAVVSAFLFIAAISIRFQLIQNYLFVGDNEYSLLTRVEAWKILFEIIGQNPVFGVGPANYYFYTPFYNILGYSVKFNSHNNYIDLLAQVGLLGTGTFIWWLVEIARTGFNLIKRELEPFEHAYAISALGGLAATLVAAFLGDWIIPFIYNVGMDGFRSSGLAWIFMGALVFLQFKTSKFRGQDQ